jgi:hypothetical protein
MQLHAPVEESQELFPPQETPMHLLISTEFPHFPLTQAPVEQALPQEPQLLTSTKTLASHPFAKFLSQFFLSEAQKAHFIVAELQNWF